jgi:hypothetical protein
VFVSLPGREQTVQSPEFLELKELMGISNNFSKYRRAVRDANPPLVPYLGRFLTDLNFIEDANKIRISANNHVNFRTCPPVSSSPEAKAPLSCVCVCVFRVRGRMMLCVLCCCVVS